MGDLAVQDSQRIARGSAAAIVCFPGILGSHFVAAADRPSRGAEGRDAAEPGASWRNGGGLMNAGFNRHLMPRFSGKFAADRASTCRIPGRGTRRVHPLSSPVFGAGLMRRSRPACRSRRRRRPLPRRGAVTLYPCRSPPVCHMAFELRIRPARRAVGALGRIETAIVLYRVEKPGMRRSRRRSSARRREPAHDVAERSILHRPAGVQGGPEAVFVRRPEGAAPFILEVVVRANRIRAAGPGHPFPGEGAVAEE